MLQKLKLDIWAWCEVIVFRPTYILVKIGYEILVGRCGTGCSAVCLTCSGIVYREPVLIIFEIAFRIVCVYGKYRCPRAGHIKRIGRSSVSLVDSVLFGLGITDVGTDLQPRLELRIDIRTGGKAFIGRTEYIRVIVKITHRHIIVRTVVSSRCRYVVFLTECVPEHGICKRIIVTKACGRVQLPIGIHQIFTVRDDECVVVAEFSQQVLTCSKIGIFNRVASGP